MSRILSLTLRTGVAALGLVAASAFAQNAICYNCPTEWADWGTQLKAIKAKTGITIPPDNKNSGQSLAQLVAEKASPVADVTYLGVTFAIQAQKDGVVQPYKPAAWNDIPDGLKDPQGNWFTIHSGTLGFMVNVDALKGKPIPKSWKDLTNPIYKGRIVMPNPASSGTGYLDVTGWILMMGEADAWKYMDGLHANVAQYTHSGSKPCRQAGAGEFPIGISFEYRAVTTKKSGAPIDIIFPTEGLGWDLEASGIMKTTKKLDAAKSLMNWLATPGAMELFSKNFAVVAIPGIAKPMEFIPADYEARLVKNDFAWSAKNRDKIIAEWMKRYDAKSEPK